MRGLEKSRSTEARAVYYLQHRRPQIETRSLDPAKLLYPVVQRGYFTDIQRALVVDPDAVRGVGELARGTAVLTPGGKQVSI